MNIPHRSGSDKSDSFVISNYLHFLNPTKEKGKYECPVCKGSNLSIHKSGKKYTCYDGCTGNQIAYKLRDLAGEFSKRKDNVEDLTQDYKPDKISIEHLDKGIEKQPSKPTTNRDAIIAVQAAIGLDLKYNLRTLNVEFCGNKIDLDSIHLILASKHNLHISKQLSTDICLFLAKQNSYDPVKEYFESCRLDGPIFSQNNIAKLLFSIDDPIYSEYLWLFLCGVVGRVYDPGLKFDYTLILQGRQGIGKSTFFRTLLPNSFSDNMSNKLGIDDLRILNAHAICEWGEISNFTAKQYADTIKAFLSRQEDQFRLPYARDLQTYPRRSVICGSTNDAQFLVDLTGNRRFMILKVEEIISTAMLSCIRSEIWGSVLYCYELLKSEGKELILSTEGKERQKEDNALAENPDLIAEILEPYLESKKDTYTTMLEVMSHLVAYNFGMLGIKGSDKSLQMRVGKILNQLGWEKKLKKVDGKVFKAWLRNG